MLTLKFKPQTKETKLEWPWQIKWHLCEHILVEDLNTQIWIKNECLVHCDRLLVYCDRLLVYCDRLLVYCGAMVYSYQPW